MIHPDLFPRKMNFGFPRESIPRFWLAGSPKLTHLGNAMNLLFPLGERFFIRSVKAYMDQIDDPELRDRVKGFMAQEVRHGMEHEGFFELLEEMGYEPHTFVDWYAHWAFEVLEPAMPKSVCLAVTTALEHYTALFGHAALTGGIVDTPDPLKELFMWHAAEEIEHKSVVFDVYEAVDGRYSVRLAGLLLATVGFVGFWVAGMRYLAKKDREMGVGAEATPMSLTDRKDALVRFLTEGAPRHFAVGFWQYAQPGFHPDQHDDYHLAAEYLASIGRLEH